MDCETFDRDVVDLLYGDGEASARDALARHAEGCARCGPALAVLRLARDQASRLPRASPPEGLTRRILEAEAASRSAPALSRRVARAASWAGSLAMRPQFAMAALFCLAVGSSLLLLRARSDSVLGPTSVREEGEPSPLPMEAPAAAPPQQVAARPRRGDQEDEGAKRPVTGQPADAEPAAAAATAEATAAPPPPAASAAAEQPSTDASKDALRAALDVATRSGCRAALPDFRGVVASHPGTREAALAAREMDVCGQAVAAGPPPPAGKAAPGKSSASASAGGAAPAKPPSTAPP
jgi:hypothetical protein